MYTTSEIFSNIANLRVLVLGDAMIDNYCYGTIERISPEAPVPVLVVEKKESRLGGAANVALNVAALGAKVQLATVVGQDKSSEKLLQLLEQENIGHELLMQSSDRVTTTKTRMIAKQQQLLRLDEEKSAPLSTKDEHRFIESVLKYIQIQKPDVVIFEDYDKGVLKENVIEKILHHCRHLGCVIAVDPKYDHFFNYHNVTIFKPNISEVTKALQMENNSTSDSTIFELATKIKLKLQPELLLITLSEKGIYYQSDNLSEIIPAKKRQVADVSGAGDTVIAVAALIYAVCKDGKTSALFANIAGGLVCEQVGVVAVDKSRLIQEAELLMGFLEK